ncbi:MAG TPA: hypothetical protein PKE26_09590 [Kiritimatiellia bacterium]|nr:hypothetical protein [Kiritimatiellia bacterium]HMO99348.1 hypothetical protein [Kiritimatiellia bacterium]HMP97442.1 hypothetical protein [Kiritimatiellia bacterium]
MKKNLYIFVILAAAIGSISCDSGGGGRSEEDRFVGTWAMHRGGTPAGEIAVYLHLKGDNTLLISNFPDGSRQRMTGTWSVQDGVLVAPFSNPPTGDGRIEAVLNADDVLEISFIEYWHTPNKVVPFAGTRVADALVPHLN